MNLRQLAPRLSIQIEQQPRPHNHAKERDFVKAWRRWQDEIRTLRIELDRVPEDDRQDANENWWDYLSDIVGVLEGRGDVVKRVCLDLGADWKEVCAAWGIFVDPRLRRQGLP
jgi:nuclear pore complex protein Nup85